MASLVQNPYMLYVKFCQISRSSLDKAPAANLDFSSGLVPVPSSLTYKSFTKQIRRVFDEDPDGTLRSALGQDDSGRLGKLRLYIERNSTRSEPRLMVSGPLPSGGDKELKQAMDEMERRGWVDSLVVVYCLKGESRGFCC
jgi:hypothetical protein